MEGDEATEGSDGVQMMDYVASITYRNPVPASVDRAIEASKENRLLGMKCPVCERVYSGGKGNCPIDALGRSTSWAGPSSSLDVMMTRTGMFRA